MKNNKYFLKIEKKKGGKKKAIKEIKGGKEMKWNRWKI